LLVHTDEHSIQLFIHTDEHSIQMFVHTDGQRMPVNDVSFRL